MLKNNISNNIVMFMASIFLFVTSCSENEVPSPSPVPDTGNNVAEGITLKDGALCFASAELYFETTSKLGKMNQSERDQWGKNIGFTSLGTEVSLALDAIGETEDENVIEQILSDNSDILTVDEDNFIIPTVISSSYASVANRNGVFYIGETIHKVEGNRIAMQENGSVDDVAAALKNGIKSSAVSSAEESADVAVFDYFSIDPSMKASVADGYCGSEKTGWNRSSDREIHLKMRTYLDICGTGCCEYIYQYVVEGIIENLKKGTFGKWKSYNTSCTLYNVAFTVDAPHVTAYNGVMSTFDYVERSYYWGTSTSGSDVATFRVWTKIGDPVRRFNNINGWVVEPHFKRVKASASNRGGVSTDINCGVW